MLPLTNQPLSTVAQSHLDSKQTDIDLKVSFANKAERAESLWGSKSSSQAGKIAFDEIKKTLIEMCVGTEICNYCEQSEATDIEHILPKSLFPEQAFAWENYLLACKICNTAYKLDKMWVFNPANSTNTYFLPRKAQPPTNDVAFIHLRHENPMDFMQLNFDDFLFYARPPHSPDTRGFQKVEKTLEILALNNRPSLVNYRKYAFGNYKRLLREYVAVQNAQNYQELEEAVIGNPSVNVNLPFPDEQDRLSKAIKRSILKGEHPTVWQEMIRQQARLPVAIQRLFQQAQVQNW